MAQILAVRIFLPGPQTLVIVEYRRDDGTVTQQAAKVGPRETVGDVVGRLLDAAGAEDDGS